MANKKINVLIADDSQVSRDLLSFIIQSDADLNVVGTAENGEKAVELAIQLNPDVIMMDVVMPKLNGIEATKKIMESKPTPIILVSGVFNRDEISKAFEAINAGAVTIIEKPKGVGDTHYLDTARFVIETIKALSVVKIHEHDITKEIDKLSTSIKPAPSNQAVEVIAIGASIGGPQTLSQMLSQLPENYPIPILLVQHISQGFAEGFAQWLTNTTSLKIKVAEEGEKIHSGTVYISPDKFQMTVSQRGIISLSDITKGRASIDILFESIATSFGAKSIAILLTGIGSDGVKGLKSIKEKGGTTIVQDPQTTLLPDLPLAAIQSGAATSVESIAKIIMTLKMIAQKNVIQK